MITEGAREMSALLAIHRAPGGDTCSLANLVRGMPLNEREAQLVASSAARVLSVEAGHEIVALGSPLDKPKFVLSGWIGLTRLLHDGRRQIVDLQTPCEMTGFDLRPGARALGAYVALTPLRYVEVGDLVAKAMAQPGMFPSLAAGLRASDGDGQARLVDQVMRNGRMLAHERMAHLALDLHRRHEHAGLSAAQDFPMPLTQEMLGDVLGLSTVHVNRTLQQLRRDGLLKTLTGQWQILNMDMLREVASGARPRHPEA